MSTANITDTVVVSDYFRQVSSSDIELRPNSNTTIYCSITTYGLESIALSGTDKDAALDAKINSSVRRPYRGISIKKESFASMAIVNSNAKSTLASRALANSSADEDVAFTCNFLINSVSESRSEKHQTVSTFGKDYIYFFGEQPRQMTFNVTLLNTENFRWEEEWWYNYEEYFRGTRLASRSEQIRLRLDESIVYGFLITCSTNKDSNNPHVVTLSFTIHVTEVVSTRSNLIGSSDVRSNQSDGSSYGYVDLNLHDGAGLSTISIGEDSAALRRYNLTQYLNTQSGWVSRLRNTLNEFSSDVRNIAQDSIDFLYGRNIVLPVDIAYSEFTSGNPQFAEGSEAREILSNSLLDTSAKVYGKGLFASDKYSNTQGSTILSPAGKLTTYTDNYDEYPLQSTFSNTITTLATEPVSLTEMTAGIIASEFNMNKEDLLANEDGILDPQKKGFFEVVRDFFSNSSFGVFQTSTASSDSVTRQKAADRGKTITYPNETANLAAINGFSESENTGV